MYISEWQAYTDGVDIVLHNAVEVGEVDVNDIVWQGPSGDYFVGQPLTAEEEEAYAEYSDAGSVREYLHE